MFRNVAQIRRFVLPALIALAATLPVVAQEVSISAPAEVKVGGEVQVTWAGIVLERDFISIDPVGAPEKTYGHGYKYARGAGVTLMAPGKPGQFEIRYHRDGSGYPVAASSPLTVLPDSATLQVKKVQVGAGEDMEVGWQGPGNPRDFISIDPMGAPEKKIGSYKYVRGTDSVKFQAPTEPGKYEVRYHLAASGYPVIGSTPLEVVATTATLDAPAQARAGETIQVSWKGPGNSRDYISIDAATAPDDKWGAYRYVKTGNPLELTVPDEVGTYEIRYRLGSGNRVVGRSIIEVTDVTASVSVTDKVTAGENFNVSWDGPNNRRDFITIVPVGTADKEFGHYSYTQRGNPLRIRAPKEAGAYEVRYLTGQAYRNLASVRVEVHPSTAIGTLRVIAESPAANGTMTDPGAMGAVEVILDASGSMLKTIGQTRRIELARRALVDLTENTLPSGIPFALRVFGHREADSCRTDLEVPLAPLDASQVAAKIRSIEAKNLAKTPIADSLRQTASDLASAKGPRLVILITDGEETCGGDPGEAIRELADAGIEARVSIVGFAIDEPLLKQRFEAWATLGGGRYFDARDGERLTQSIQQAMQPTYHVLVDSEVVAGGIVGGEAIELGAGEYQVRLATGRELGSFTVSADEETLVRSSN